MESIFGRLIFPDAAGVETHPEHEDLEKNDESPESKSGRFRFVWATTEWGIVSVRMMRCTACGTAASLQNYKISWTYSTVQ